MDAESRKLLKQAVDKATRERVIRRDLSPEALTLRAIEADELGYTELAAAFRSIRDKVVNPLLGEGWSMDKIEQAAFNHFKGDQT